MEAPVIELHSVRKSYRSRGSRTVAVDGLTLSIPSGGVHGYLGPNGSGKTTTIRMILGLVAPDAGKVRVLGADVPDRLPEVVGSIGALVESPQLFPAFSGRRNLAILARLHGLPEARVEQMLDLVGLADRGEDRVRGYSLGMRQRLAIAAAMLKQPRLLILDEPMNGLDPAGMVEVRELIRRLGAESTTTVFLSSHLLTEVAAVCDAVTILRRGSLIATGSVAEILMTANARKNLRIRIAETGAATAVLEAAGIEAAIDPGQSRTIVVESTDGALVNYLLGSAGHWAEEITAMGHDLESAFLELTSEEVAS